MPRHINMQEKIQQLRAFYIVIAQIGGEWTLKYYGKDREGIYLDPANARYARIRPARSLHIGGIVRAVIRKYA